MSILFVPIRNTLNLWQSGPPLVDLINKLLTQGKSDLFRWDIPHFISRHWSLSHTPDGQVVWLGWFIAIHPCENRLYVQKSTFVFSLFICNVYFYKTNKSKISHSHCWHEPYRDAKAWQETVWFTVKESLKMSNGSIWAVRVCSSRPRINWNCLLRLLHGIGPWSRCEMN